MDNESNERLVLVHAVQISKADMVRYYNYEKSQEKKYWAIPHYNTRAKYIGFWIKETLKFVVYKVEGFKKPDEFDGGEIHPRRDVWNDISCGRILIEMSNESYVIDDFRVREEFFTSEGLNPNRDFLRNTNALSIRASRLKEDAFKDDIFTGMVTHTPVEKWGREGWVYILGVMYTKKYITLNGPQKPNKYKSYKVGFTTRNVEARINECQTGNNQRIVLCAKIYTHDARKLENLLHGKFKDRRDIGEWFLLSDDELLLVNNTAVEKS